MKNIYILSDRTYCCIRILVLWMTIFAVYSATDVGAGDNKDVSPSVQE